MSDAIKTPFGGWRSQDHGLEPGKNIETRVTKFEKPSNGSNWLMFEMFRAFQSRKAEDAGAWKKGFNFPLNPKAIREMVDRLNHLMNNYTSEKGSFVWMPATNAGYVEPTQLPPQQQAQPGYPPAALPHNQAQPMQQPSPQGYPQPQGQPPQQQQFGYPAPPQPQGGNQGGGFGVP